MTDGSKLTLFCCLMLIGIDCGHPGDIADGSVAGGFLFNDTVTYNCHSGFSITSGDSHLTCQADGTWIGIKPTCSSKFHIYSIMKFTVRIFLHFNR